MGEKVKEYKVRVGEVPLQSSGRMEVEGSHTAQSSYTESTGSSYRHRMGSGELPSEGGRERSFSYTHFLLSGRQITHY